MPWSTSTTSHSKRRECTHGDGQWDGEQPVPDPRLFYRNAGRVSAITGAMAGHQPVQDRCDNIIPGFRATPRPGLDGYSKPFYGNAGWVDETDRGSSKFQQFPVPGPAAKHTACMSCPTRNTADGSRGDDAERTGANLGC